MTRIKFDYRYLKLVSQTIITESALLSSASNDQCFRGKSKSNISKYIPFVYGTDCWNSDLTSSSVLTEFSKRRAQIETETHLEKHRNSGVHWILSWGKGQIEKRSSPKFRSFSRFLRKVNLWSKVRWKEKVFAQIFCSFSRLQWIFCQN